MAKSKTAPRAICVQVTNILMKNDKFLVEKWNYDPKGDYVGVLKDVESAIEILNKFKAAVAKHHNEKELNIAINDVKAMNEEQKMKFIEMLKEQKLI